MRTLTILLCLTLAGCVSYQQQISNRYNRLLAESKSGNLAIDSNQFQNHLEIENGKILAGKEIALRSMLPVDNLSESYNILILDNFLLIPIQVHSEVSSNAEYSLIWDGKYILKDQDLLTVRLIFEQKLPPNFKISNDRPFSNKGPAYFHKTWDGQMIPNTSRNNLEKSESKVSCSPHFF